MSLDTLQIDFISEIKDKIRKAQYEALKEVNLQLINLYWELGKSIAEKQKENWDKAIVPTLSKELQKEFPRMGGFSRTNMWQMAHLNTEYQSNIKHQPLDGEINWTNQILILNKCKETQERRLYTIATKKFGCTKNILIHQIENKTHEKYLFNQMKFEETLPEDIQNQAVFAVKDSLTFAFLDLSNEPSERELENVLIQNIRNFFLELGLLFSFLGNQIRVAT